MKLPSVYSNMYLEQAALKLLNGLEAAGFVTDVEPNQIYNLAEEVGEFVGAYRRWKGLARRSGTFDDVRHELADVVITSYVTAAVLDIDLARAIREKFHIIFSRGFRENNETQELEQIVRHSCQVD